MRGERWTERRPAAESPEQTGALRGQSTPPPKRAHTSSKGTYDDPRPCALRGLTQFEGPQLVFLTHEPTRCRAAFMVCEALHLPPDASMRLAGRRVTHDEQKYIFDLIETRIRTRKPVAISCTKAYLRGIPFYVDERTIVRGHILARF